MLSLILSDVTGDPLDFIASGPTVPNNSTSQDCLALFHKLKIKDSVPKSVLEVLEMSNSSTHISDINWSNVNNVLVGTNKIACDKAKAQSDYSGYETLILSTELDGDVQNVSEMFSALADEALGMNSTMVRHVAFADTRGRSVCICFLLENAGTK